MNRRKFDYLLDTEINRSNLNSYGFSLMFCDVDYFKQVNDSFGHDIGDVVLQSFSRILKQELQKTDIVARWG